MNKYLGSYDNGLAWYLLINLSRMFILMVAFYLIGKWYSVYRMEFSIIIALATNTSVFSRGKFQDSLFTILMFFAFQVFFIYTNIWTILKLVELDYCSLEVGFYMLLGFSEGYEVDDYIKILNCRAKQE